jgi:RNA polymerase sigma-70 factor (ECF subfamily)
MSGNIDLPSVIAYAQQGKADAVHVLYRAYADPIRRYCYARLGDIEAAHDCVQEVFLKVWKAIRSFVYRDELSFLSWLYTIANHVVISDIRKRKLVQLPLDPDLDAPSGQDLGRTVTDQLVLWNAIRQLTPDQQQVITLKFFAGLSLLEIAQIIKRREGAVKALQHRALRRLQSLLSNENNEQGTHQGANVSVSRRREDHRRQL